MKKTIALILAFVMVFSLLPVNVLATEVEPIAEESEDAIVTDSLPEENADDNSDLPDESLHKTEEDDTTDSDAEPDIPTEETDLEDPIPEDVDDDKDFELASEVLLASETQDLEVSVIASGTCGAQGDNLTW